MARYWVSSEHRTSLLVFKELDDKTMWHLEFNEGETFWVRWERPLPDWVLFSSHTRAKSAVEEASMQWARLIVLGRAPAGVLATVAALRSELSEEVAEIIVGR